VRRLITLVVSVSALLASSARAEATYQQHMASTRSASGCAAATASGDSRIPAELPPGSPVTTPRTD